MIQPTLTASIDKETISSSLYELKLYPLENDYIGCLDTTNVKYFSEKMNSRVETVIIIDRSGSMGNSVYKITHKILPKFFENLSYDPETVINLICFESSAKLHKIKVCDFENTPMFSGGGTAMAPAVAELHKIFEEFQSSVTSLRILTISDGEIFDPEETKNLGDNLASFAAKCNISVNSQAVRFFTSYAQPDTTALCSLLQLSNVDKSQMIDVCAEKHHDKAAKEMSDLFENDGFNNTLVLKSNENIFYKFPWEEEALNILLILPNRKNIFWIDEIPNEKQQITINDVPVKITVEKDISIDTFQMLLMSKLDFVIDHMKILKIVNTKLAILTIERMVEYFSRIENTLASLITHEFVDPKSIANRARLLKLEKIRSRKITTFLQTIANDDKVNQLNADQKAAYLRSVQASCKSGRGLAKRNAKKKKKKIGAKELSIDDIVRKEVISIFFKIKYLFIKNRYELLGAFN